MTRRVTTDTLSRREQATVQHLAQGMTTADIARRLGVKPASVRSYIRCIAAKWGTSSRTEIVQVARHRGLIPAEAATSEAHPQLQITAAIGARLKQATPKPSPILLGAKPSPLAGLTDLAVRAAADRALRADLERGGAR